MNNAAYSRNVLKTFSNRPAQLGLRFVASNLKRTHIMHAGFGLHSEMTELVVALSKYLQGDAQWDNVLAAKAADEMGDVAYFLRVLAKHTKAYLPPSIRKSKLKGYSRTEAIFELLRISERIASLQKKTFYGPKFKEDAVSIDRPATRDMCLGRMNNLKDLVQGFAMLFWPLVWDALHITPGELFDKNIEKLAVRYPEGFFDLSAEESKDEEAELAAQS